MSIDVGTQLVRAYLEANGFFTIVDYPLVELDDADTHTPRSVTDVDVLAIRFGRPPTTTAESTDDRHTVGGPLAMRLDPALGCPEDQTTMVVAEVKQGRAHVNPASRNPQTLKATLDRFGCCEPAEAEAAAHDLIKRGKARGAHGHAIRMLLFAGQGESAPRGWRLIPLDHVFMFLGTLLRKQRYWRAAHLHDPALAWITLVQKCGLSLKRDESG
jgi:hypothetical protein